MIIDVTEALPRTLQIPTPSHELNIPLIYEGLHEVYALCGSPIHAIDKRPCLPSLPKIEIMVEKFQAHNLSGATFPHASSSGGAPEAKEKWIRVSPKKRGRPSSTPPNPRVPFGGIRISEPQASPPPSLDNNASPSAKDKGKVVLVEEENTLANPILEGIPLEGATSGLFPLLPHEIIPPPSSTMLLSIISLEATHVLSPILPLDRNSYLGH